MKEFFLKSKCDGLKISCSMIVPKNNIKGIVQIVHGMCEHKERYYDFMKYLSDNGYIAVINDHRGHGKSIKNKNDLGYFYDETGTCIVEDIHQIIKYIKSKYKGLKLYLLGHSMGALIVENYIKKYDKEIDKLIISGSPNKNNLINMAIFLDKLIIFFKSDKYKSKLLEKGVNGPFVKRFKDENNNYSWICSNKDIVNEYSNDSLCGFNFTTNGYLNLFLLMKNRFIRKEWKLNNISLPIIFIAGSNDPVIKDKKSLIYQVNFLKKLGYKNVEYKIYKDLRHEVLNEINNDEVYLDIINFINK